MFFCGVVGVLVMLVVFLMILVCVILGDGWVSLVLLIGG